MNQLTAIPTLVKFTVSASALAEAIKRTVPLIDKDTTRYAFHAIHVESSEGSVRIMVTDGRRIATQDIPSFDATPGRYFLIDHRDAKSLATFCRKLGKKFNVVISVEGDRVLVEGGLDTFECLAVEGRFPRTAEIFATQYNTTASIDAKDFAEIIAESVPHTEDEEVLRGVTLTLCPSIGAGSNPMLVAQVTIDNETPYRRCTPCQVVGKGGYSILNAEWLAAMAKTIGVKGRFHIALNDHKSQVRIMHEGFTFIIMPIYDGQKPSRKARKPRKAKAAPVAVEAAPAVEASPEPIATPEAPIVATEDIAEPIILEAVEAYRVDVERGHRDWAVASVATIYRLSLAGQRVALGRKLDAMGFSEDFHDAKGRFLGFVGLCATGSPVTFPEPTPATWDEVEFAPVYAPISGGSPEATEARVGQYHDIYGPIDPFATCLDIPTVEDDHQSDEWILEDAYEAIIVAPSRRSRLAHVEDAIRVIVLHILATEVRIGSAARVAWTHRMSQDRREDFAEWLEATGVRIDPFGDAPTDPAECFEWMVVESRDGCLVSFPEPSTDPDRSDDHDSDTEASSVVVPVPAGLRAGDAGQDHRPEVACDDANGIARLSHAGVPRGRGPAPRVEAPAPAAGDVEAPDTLTIGGEPYEVARTEDGYEVMKWTGDCYAITLSGSEAPSCECGDFRHRRAGLDSLGCKHIRGLRDAGFLPTSTNTPLGGDPGFSGSALLALHNLAPISGGSEEADMIVIRQIETPEERVDALDEETIRKVLVRLVKTTEAHGAPTVILRVLNEWSLLSDRVADVPDGIAPSLVNAVEHLLAPRLHVGPVQAPPVARLGSALDVILATPIPSERGRIRRSDRKTMAAEVRKLFKELGIKGCSVTAPSYSMASGIDIRIPGAEEHDRGWQTGHDFATCDKCGKHRDAEKHIRVIIEGAFPDMIDRSDTQSDYHDNPLHIS